MSDEELVSAMKETVLAYDNMCHLNSLRAARKDLPLPSPFDKMWKTIQKVIDRLHLQNHKNPSSKINYNPDNVLSESCNTMAAKQVNVWASRLKRIMVAMPYIHHMFFFTEWSEGEIHIQSCAIKLENSLLLQKLQRNGANELN